MKLFSHCSIVSLALAAGLALAPDMARAQVAGLTFTFAPDTLTADSMGNADYTALFTNTTATDYYVTGGVYFPSDTTGSPLVSGFFNGDPANGNSPFDVAAGSSLTVTGVFSLTADPSLGSGVYDGAVDFQGQTASDFLAGMGSDTTLASAPLTLVIGQGTPPAVPEASSVVSLGVLLALGLGGVAVSRRRKVVSAS